MKILSTLGVFMVFMVIGAQPTHAGLFDKLNETVEGVGKNILKTPKDKKKPDSTDSAKASPVEELAKKDISKATTIGNYAGGITGALIGNDLCRHKIKGCKDNAVINAAVVAAMTKLGSDIGSFAGKAIGETAANRRREYATEKDFLESEISASEKAIAVREGDLNDTNQQIGKHEKRIKELEGKLSLTKREIAEAEQIKSELESQKDKNDNLIVQYNEKIAYLNHTLETSESQLEKTQEDTKDWQKRYDSLKDKRDRLVAQRDAVEKQNVQLSSDQVALDKIIT